MVVSKIISNKEEVFEDAIDGWALEENQRVTIVYSKEKMSALLADIDRLVDNEKISEKSSDEDHRAVETKILEIGSTIKSNHKPSKKANKLPRAGFHFVPYPQPTPSRSYPKKLK